MLTKTSKTPLLQSAACGLHCRLARLCLRASSRTTTEPPMGLFQTADCSRGKNIALRAKKQELLEHLELLNFLNSMKTAVRSFFSGAQRNDVFSAVAAEFRNETVLYLRLVRELALRRYAVSAGRELKELSRHSGFFIVFVIKHLLPKLQLVNCF